MMRSLLLRGAGLALSILPPAVATVSYFPLWAERGGEAILSGFTAFILLLCAIPIFKLLKRLLASPSVWVMWLFAFILFYMLSRIADEMVVISLIGAVSNMLGAILFKLSEGGRNEKP